MRFRHCTSFVLLTLALIAFSIAAAQTEALDPSFGIGGLVTTNIGVPYSQSGKAIALQPDGRIVVGGWSFATSDGLLILSRFDPDGQLDTSFGEAGVVSRSFGGWDAYATAVAIQSDGRIVVSVSDSGRQYAMILCLLSNGDPDLSFGDEGLVEVEIGSASLLKDLALLEDGRIIAVGNSTVDALNALTFIRLLADGTFDSTFGTGGIARVRVGSSGGYGTALVLDQEGNAVAAGRAFNGTDYDFVLVRVLPSGLPDETLGSDGVVTTNVTADNDRAEAIAVQNDGRIVVAGHSGDWNSSNLNTDFTVVRYLPDGTLDQTFGAGGVSMFSISTQREGLFGIAIQPDQKLVVAGFSLMDIGGSTTVLARLNASGMLDPSFGEGGIATPPSDQSTGIAYDLVLVDPPGQSKSSALPLAVGEINDDVALIRYLADGTLDPLFGDGGIAMPGGLGHGNHISGASLLLPPDDRIIVSAEASRIGGTSCFLVRYGEDGNLDLSFGEAGSIELPMCQEGGNALARGDGGGLIAAGAAYPNLYVAKLDEDGEIDLEFGDNGVALIETEGSGRVSAVMVQPDGKIVVVANHAIARLDESGDLDASFGNGGVVETEVGPTESNNSAVLTPDGRIVVGGRRAGFFALARFLSSGTIDSSFGTDGEVRIPFSSGYTSANALAQYPDGRIIAGGRADQDFALARLLSDGTLDDTFNHDGRLQTSVTLNADYLTALALQFDGKIVASGYSGDAYLEQTFTVVRFDEAGSFDPTFGDGGVATTTFGDAAQESAAVLIQQSGRIVAVGRAGIREATDIAIAGYLPTTTTESEPSVSNPSETAMQVYPNPANDVLVVESGEGLIEILDVLGRRVLTARSDGGEAVVDITALLPGAYVVRAGGQSRVITVRR